MEPKFILTSLSEPLTELTRAHLRSKVRKEIARGNFLHVIDVRGISQLDTSTLSEVIRVRRWLREVGGALTLVADQPHILKILTIAGLDRVIGVHPDEEAAFAALGASSLIPA